MKYRLGEREARPLAYDLLGILQKLSPNGGEQAALTDTYNEAVKEEGYIGALRTMSNILSDGMQYGNWPWINADGTIREKVPS